MAGKISEIDPIIREGAKHLRPPRSRMGEKESCSPGRGERYRRHTELQRQACIYKTQAAPSSFVFSFLLPANRRVESVLHEGVM